MKMTTATRIDSMSKINKPRDVIAIYQSSDREGSTFSLKPDSQRALQARFGGRLHLAPRIFVAHERYKPGASPDLKRLHGSLARPLVALLTGLDQEALGQLENIEFWDPVVDELM
jgi:hypothetical protein